VKIKASFVTNSSSASMIIDKSVLNDFKIICLKHHIEAANLLLKIKSWTPVSYHDRWIIEESRKYIYGTTIMENFDMSWFLAELNISRKSFLVLRADDEELEGIRKGKKIKLFNKLSEYRWKNTFFEEHKGYNNIINIIGEKLKIQTPCSGCLVKTICVASPHDNSVCDEAVKFFRKQYRKYTEKTKI